MPTIITSARGRALAASLIGVALQAAVQLGFGAWQGWDPLLALAVGMLVAVVAGSVAGRLAGGAVAVAGSAFFLAYAGEDAGLAAVAIPFWLAAGIAAGLASDLWARARHERNRARAEAEMLREAGPAALVTVGPDDTIVDWNTDAEEIFGRPDDKTVGETASILGADIGSLVAKAREGGVPAEGRARHTREDGATVRLLIRVLPHTHSSDGAVLVTAVDVSEAERLDDELREVRARFDALHRNLPVITYTHPPGERHSLTYVSPQVETLLGYAVHELAEDGKGLVRLVHPEDRDRLAEELRTVGSHERVRAEYRLLARDGRVVPVRDDATTVRDSKGKPLYVQGFIVDLSDRAELHRERERLTLASRKASSEALTRQKRLDLAVEAGELLSSSVEATTALRRVAELAVRDFADWCAVDLVPEDGALARFTAAHGEVIRDAQARARAPGAAPEPEVQEVAKRAEPLVVPPIGEADSAERDSSGSERESRILAPMVARGHTVGVLSFSRRGSARPYGADDLAVAVDVARRAAMTIDAERLYDRVEQEADAARVLTYVADGVFLVDRTGTIRLWNAAAEVITGFPAASMVGRRPADAIRGWERLREQIPVSAAAAPALPHTLSLETPQGERWISVSAVEFFGGTVYAFRDITEAHRLEELKAEFVATASHELRTPLAAVYGAAQTLRRHDFALDEAGRERFVSMIVDEADRLGRIVNEILLANQLDAGDVELATEAFEPRDLLERVAEATRSYMPEDISLDVVASGRLPQVAADRDKVRQVLVNLVDNAVKYSPDGGKVQIGLEPQDGSVRFFVRDNGLGIPPDEQGRIFEKFYRLDPGMTRGVGGTGLGLYISNELVRRMGGRIRVESEEGEGSTFSFQLPSAEAAGQESQPGAPV